MSILLFSHIFNFCLFQVNASTAPPYREGATTGGYTRSPRLVPRQLGPVVRPVYDDRSLSGAGAALPPNKSRHHVKYADAEIIANPLAKRAYYRSVSSLDVSLEEDDTPRPTLLKEYSGSASSIDLGKTGKTSRHTQIGQYDRHR